MSEPDFSVVLPVYNEAGNLAPLHHEIEAALSPLGTYEIIYVNDGSTDTSLQELQTLHNATIVNMMRSYGQTTAFDAGFKLAAGKIVISMDADGQNDPNDIPLLLQKMHDEHLDVVAGWRKIRRDRKGIRILTRIGHLLRRLLINDPVHDSGCALRIYTHEAAKSLDIGGEMHRYILALLRWKGFSVGEVVVNDRARVHGVSKYNYSKAIRGFIDLIYVWFIYKYSQRPLHLFGYLSLGAFALSIVSLVLTIYEKLVHHVHVNRNGWFFLTFFFLLGAIMLFSFGVIIDLVIRIYLNTSPSEKRYYVREVLHT